MPFPESSEPSKFSAIQEKKDEKNTVADYDAMSSEFCDTIQEQLRRLSPNGGLCTVGLTSNRIRVYHLLPKDTDPQCIKQLEFAWGLEPGTLNVNDVRNMLFKQRRQFFDAVEEELLIAFMRGDWTLAPTNETLTAVVMQTGADDMSTLINEHTTTQFGPQKVYTYELVSWNEPASQSPTTKNSGFPLIRSHVHPCFAVCNTGLRNIRQKYPFGGELNSRAGICNGVYNCWLAAKPYSPLPPPPQSSTTASSCSWFSISTPPESSDKSSTGPKRKYNGGRASGCRGTKRQRTMFDKSLAKLGTTGLNIQKWIDDVKAASR
ncbi:hypothetical protein RhiJN_26886 [Ceratobasidium sp. AG-Ba]|nr:hypothetical protein RhiJN_12839 [Ceratobasidium sp. AG-Ba]QRV98867.1 hypothetical protein RhiJN_26886 [Ceratobasidium sp. AG-Ba]